MLGLRNSLPVYAFIVYLTVQQLKKDKIFSTRSSTQSRVKKRPSQPPENKRKTEFTITLEEEDMTCHDPQSRDLSHSNQPSSQGTNPARKGHSDSILPRKSLQQPPQRLSRLTSNEETPDRGPYDTEKAIGNTEKQLRDFYSKEHLKESSSEGSFTRIEEQKELSLQFEEERELEITTAKRKRKTLGRVTGPNLKKKHSLAYSFAEKDPQKNEDLEIDPDPDNFLYDPNYSAQYRKEMSSSIVCINNRLHSMNLNISQDEELESERSSDPVPISVTFSMVGEKYSRVTHASKDFTGNYMADVNSQQISSTRATMHTGEEFDNIETYDPRDFLDNWQDTQRLNRKSTRKKLKEDTFKKTEEVSALQRKVIQQKQIKRSPTVRARLFDQFFIIGIDHPTVVDMENPM